MLTSTFATNIAGLVLSLGGFKVCRTTITHPIPPPLPVVVSTDDVFALLQEELDEEA